jgi:hypothetical protein
MLWLNKVWHWPFDPNNVQEATGFGFWFGLISVLVGFIGFGLTLRQLRKTKNASEAAQLEVQRIRSSLGAYDGVQEASRAAYALSMTLTLVRNQMWKEAGDTYTDVRQSLMRIKTLDKISEAQKYQIDEAVKYIASLCRRVDSQISKGKVNIDLAKTCSVLRQHGELVSDIQDSMRRELL